MASIRYNVTRGELPITVNLLDEGMNIIDTNIHSIYEEGEFDNISSGTYTIQMIEDNGCIETYMVCEGGCGYGLLYNGWVLEDASSIAADGWHVITNHEIMIITIIIGGTIEGATLAQSGTDYWNIDFGTNTTGMSVRGSGKRAYNTGAYSGIYNTFYGWTADDFNANYRYIYSLSTDGVLYTGDIIHKRSGLAIRLVKDDDILENYTGNDGKVYETVKIGGIVVTAQNIAETKYANGDLIPSYGIHGDTYTSAEWIALTEGALCPYNNDWQLACMSNAAIDYCKFGVLYNWSAVSDIRGIAPTGYHVPTYTEWDTLIAWLGTNGYGYGGSGEDVAKAMCYTLGWNNNNVAGSPGREQWLNNSTGFSALASGQRYYSGTFCPQGTIFHIWTSTINYTVGFINNSADNFTFINTGGDDKSGLAIRCLRDDLVGYIEGETVEDYDGNIYTTVQLGTQVWLVENLKVGHYNNGDLIPIVDDDTEWSTLVTGACCAYNYDWARYTCVPIPTTTTTTTTTAEATTTTTTEEPTTTTTTTELTWELLFQINTIAEEDFQAEIGGGLVDWKWDMGDGNFLYTEIINYDYPDATEKTVKLYYLTSNPLVVERILVRDPNYMYSSKVIGDIDLSNIETINKFVFVIYQDYSIGDPQFGNVTFSSSIVGTTTYIYLASSSMTTLDLSMFNSFELGYVDDLIGTSSGISIYSMPNLENIIFAESITGKLSVLVFSSLNKITTLDLSVFDSFEDTAYLVVNGCDLLTDVTFAESITGKFYAIYFEHCPSIVNLDLSAFTQLSGTGYTTILVRYMNNLESITFAETITGKIKSFQLNENPNLESLDLSMFTDIYDTSFYITASNNYSLTSVLFPVPANEFTLIGLDFTNCNLSGTIDLSWIYDFEIYDENTLYPSIDFSNNTGITNITLPTGTVNILNYIYLDGCNLSSIDFSIITCRHIILSNNSSLLSVILPSSDCFVFYGNGCSLNYVDFSNFVINKHLSYIDLDNNAMTATEVNRILVELDAIAVSADDGMIRIGGTNAAPDNSSGGYNGTAAKSSLQGKGFTVYTN